MNAPGIDIHLVPVGPQGYELYCEVEPQAAEQRDGQSAGLLGKLSNGFHRAVAYVENERQRRHERAHEAGRRTWSQRLRDRTMAWIAERVAEQRLLWHLRTQQAARVHHADDLTDGQASAIVMTTLRRDARRHLMWAIIDACADSTFATCSGVNSSRHAPA